MRCVGALLIVLASACLSRPSSQGGARSDASSDGLARGDAVGSDAPSDSFCMLGSHVVYEDWAVMGVDCDKGMPATSGSAALKSSNAQIYFAAGGMNSYAKCTYSPFPDTTTHVLAVIGRVDSVLVGANDATYLQVYAGTESVAIQALADGSVNDPPVLFLDHTGAPAGLQASFAGAMWWRITFPTPTLAVGEVSTDGSSWTSLGSSPIAGGTAAVNIGMFSASGFGGVNAAFDKLYYCQ